MEDEVKNGETQEEAQSEEVKAEESKDKQPSEEVKAEETQEEAQSEEVKAEESKDKQPSEQVKAEETKKEVQPEEVKAEESKDKQPSEQVKAEKTKKQKASDEKKKTAKEKKAPDKPMEKMTVVELRELAKAEIPDVEGVHAMKKDQLLALLKDKKGIKEEVPAKGKKAKFQKPTAEIKKLKSKIIVLREQKEAARQKGDRKGVDVFRRRMNRLKKRTRRLAQG